MILLMLAVTRATMSNLSAQVQALAALMRGLPPGLDGLTNPGPSLGALDSETLQLLSAATGKLDSNCFAPKQMGA
ncbi:hypothetical protein AK812_SmicGene42444 [Symbiodinium microadriaticum]|uniref:Uncharacterized protein n=1 Tax=Symbiodinium microadriaticum TaxID=2951 RepID=A0A1Q9C3J9_SYMMI|nr:hypothetical protein AK812_SmicGene42444 [Symbiodinium microadriaticum]